VGHANIQPFWQACTGYFRHPFRKSPLEERYIKHALIADVEETEIQSDGVNICFHYHMNIYSSLRRRSSSCEPESHSSQSAV
jgi:hypothetical protein